MKKSDIKKLETAARMLRAVAHPVRIGVLNLLKSGKKLSVGDIQASLAISQSMTSQHLGSLKDVGIVNFEKDGNVCYYYLENKDVLRLLECLKGCCGKT